MPQTRRRDARRERGSCDHGRHDPAHKSGRLEGVCRASLGSTCRPRASVSPGPGFLSRHCRPDHRHCAASHRKPRPHLPPLDRAGQRARIGGLRRIRPLHDVGDAAHHVRDPRPAQCRGARDGPRPRNQQRPNNPQPCHLHLLDRSRGWLLCRSRCRDFGSQRARPRHRRGLAWSASHCRHLDSPGMRRAGDRRAPKRLRAGPERPDPRVGLSPLVAAHADGGVLAGWRLASRC
jgi:hypothetical protein